MPDKQNGVNTEQNAELKNVLMTDMANMDFDEIKEILADIENRPRKKYLTKNEEVLLVKLIKEGGFFAKKAEELLIKKIWAWCILI